ncbi:hypothetical protein WJX73_008656 [Symbiochloris irregularis]|uniref:beta-mannosidase n=1 Tax=Symbiochloris irregularis TaxID=706552 RepID=A0AAW1PY91_9CHLO
MSVSADLPVYTLQALQDQELISDPLYRYGEEALHWTTDVDWNFTKEFQLPYQMLAHQHVHLLCEGLDTVADILVNGKLAASTKNAFRLHRVPIKHLLQQGPNTVLIVIRSATQYAAQKEDSYPYELGRAFPTRYNFIRKPGSDFGWDWGPGFAAAGIYGSVELHAFDAAYLTGATATSEQICEVQVRVPLGVDRWWPAGYGPQPLFTFLLTYTPDDGPPSSLRRRVGFRTLELVREPLRNSTPGESFYFAVNDVPIYAKGANVIPMDIFHSRRSQRPFLAGMIADARAANMNMLRLWGGGLPYFSDLFYDLCDEAGILIWQEATFACALYPRDGAFLDEVEKEVQYQARRISHHACLAVWGGNNEVEQIVEGWGQQKNPRLYAVDYARLFIDTVRPAIQQAAPQTPFVDTSPNSGILSSDPYVKTWLPTSDHTRGDMHFYDYTNNCLDLTKLPRGKFMSEYGVLSYPSFVLLAQQTSAEDWSYDSPMSEFRMRHPGGNQQLLDQLKMHFHVPPPAARYNDSTEVAEAFQAFIYLSQVQQAMCYESSIAYWRRIKSDPDASTMGVLYWQLNDVWAGPSWSSTNQDVDGSHWKPLHYAARRFYADFLVSGMYADGNVDVWVTSDLGTRLTGTVDIVAVPWAMTSSHDSVQPHVTTQTFTLGAYGSQRIATHPLDSLLPEMKDSHMAAQPRISLARIFQRSSMEVTLHLACDQVAVQIYLDAWPLKGRFSDNLFSCLPGRDVRLSFVCSEGDQDCSMFVLRRLLIVRSLGGTLAAGAD